MRPYLSLTDQQLLSDLATGIMPHLACTAAFNAELALRAMQSLRTLLCLSRSLAIGGLALVRRHMPQYWVMLSTCDTAADVCGQDGEATKAAVGRVNISAVGTAEGPAPALHLQRQPQQGR